MEIRDYQQRAVAAQLARWDKHALALESVDGARSLVPSVPAPAPVAPLIDPNAPVSQPRGRLRITGSGAAPMAPLGSGASITEATSPINRHTPISALADLPELQIGLTPETERFLGNTDPTQPTPRQLEVITQIGESDHPRPLVDATLESLPIGHYPFEDLSGSAGTGKTTLVRKLLELSEPGSVVLAATTGIAAVNLGEGTTINALLGFFNNQDLQEKFIAGRIQQMLRKHRAAGVRRIILDEKSMLHGQALTCITRAIDQVNQPRSQSLEAIGQDLDTASDDLPPQLSLTICGDFGQLPPVPDKDPKDPKGRKNLPIQFAFDSPEWPRFAEHRTGLTKIWRQDSQPFIQALHAVRRGDARAALDFFTPDRFADFTDDTFDGTTIYAKNDEVDRYNQLRLDRLATPILRSYAVRWGKPRSDWKNIPDELTVKEGALVTLLANYRVPLDSDDPRRGELVYANGDQGQVVEQQSDNGGWLVRIRRTGVVESIVPILREHTIPLEPGRRKELVDLNQAHRIKSKEKQEIIGTIVYMPLRLGYASTVHRSQGLTLDNVQINIRDEFWRMPNMLYVALSRARTAEGLRIVGNQVGFAERCRAEAKVLPWL